MKIFPKECKVGLVTEGFRACDEKVQEVVRKAVQLYLPSANVQDVSIPLHEKGTLIILIH